MQVTRTSTIEEIIENIPESVKYLMQEGIRCVICGEPIWGTLEEAAKEKNFDDQKIDKFVNELNAFVSDK